MTTLISTSGGAFTGSLRQPLSHKSTVAEMKGGKDPVKARRERGRNENEHTGLIAAAQMKDERAVKIVRFHLFQMHADMSGG